MKTKAQAIQKAKQVIGNREFAVYQFPRGHWGYASLASPVGIALQDTGMIYPELGIFAMAWEVVA